MTLPAEPQGPPPDGTRPTRLRMASLHLRMGALSLARAELEALAGRGALDEAALVDLAEARWRTGDLAGAGEAADALLVGGRSDPLALVIAAEAVAAVGRPGEARRLAGRALAAIDEPLEAVFAGMPRSLIWPSDAAEVPAAVAEEAGEPIATRAPVESGPDLEAGAAGRGTATEPARAPTPMPTSSAAAEAFAGGRAALVAGDAAAAGLQLAVALRLDPGFAAGVMEALGAISDDPQLALVAGDALRLLGRESEALEAFERVRAAHGYALPGALDADEPDADAPDADAPG